jgi:capsular exopolysaccharide synthesis family protein
LALERNGDAALEIREYLRILRNRWKLIIAVFVLSMLAALAVSLLTTPKYAASTQLFVSTTGQESTSSAYQGGLFSQQRVTSYAQLIQGQQVAQRVIDTLRLPISAGQVTSEVSVKTVLDSVILGVTVTDASPERARDIANALSTEFTKMVAELETPQGSTTAAAKVTVVQQATLPTTPVVPQTVRNIGLGAVVGLLLGVGFAVLRDRLDNTLKTRRDVLDAGGAAAVGAVPFDPERPKHPLISFGEGRSSSAEAFRQLRTNLQFLDVDNPPRMLVVSSAIPGEGKTTMALNLAFVLAEAGHRVALVEADMRRPRVSRYLQLVEGVGLTNILSGTAALDDVLQATGNVDVHVLAAGSHPPNPSELLGSSHMQRLLVELRERFDYVVLDAPPLLPVTDGAVLTNLTDGVLLVARYGHTKREQLTRAAENLRAIDARVLGTILNMVPSKSTDYEYAYYYDEQPALAPPARGNAQQQGGAAPGSASLENAAPAVQTGSSQRS